MTLDGHPPALLFSGEKSGDGGQVMADRSKIRTRRPIGALCLAQAGRRSAYIPALTARTPLREPAPAHGSTSAGPLRPAWTLRARSCDPRVVRRGAGLSAGQAAVDLCGEFEDRRNRARGCGEGVECRGLCPEQLGVLPVRIGAQQHVELCDRLGLAGKLGQALLVHLLQRDAPTGQPLALLLGEFGRRLQPASCGSTPATSFRLASAANSPRSRLEALSNTNEPGHTKKKKKKKTELLVLIM